MLQKTKIELPAGWYKQDRKTVVHESGLATITLKEPRADYAYNIRKFHLMLRNEWVKQYQVTGEGMWIADFNSLLEAINYADKEMSK